MVASFLVGPVLALGVAPVVAGGGGSDSTAEQKRLEALADRCGSQIEWLRDQIGPDDAGGAFKYVERGKPAQPTELKGLVDAALARAQAERRLVLWHVYRFQGMQMYRAPNLDDYMDQVPWSDPALIDLVTRNFVPLRTQCTKELGKQYGLVAWDVVEPALVFLTPDGKVAHVIDRIRTFDPKWFAEVLRRVLAAHPELDPDDASAPAAAAFATLDATTLETTRRTYYDGLAAFLGGDEKGALEKWHALTESAPDSPFAWRAAANLIPAPDKTWPGAARHGFEWPFETWLPPDGAIPTDTRWRRTPAEARSVAENAVQWLLHMQRPDGSWNDSRYAYWDTPLITPNAWMAITALAASALTEWRELAPEEIDAALARAEDYLFTGGRLNAGKNEESYAHAYRIDYLQRTLAQTEDAAQREELLNRMGGLVEKLVLMQGKTGQWAHEYDNAFISAVVLESLDRAKRLGVPVPEAVVAKGIEGLQGARCDDGSYAYGGRVPAGSKGSDDARKNACGRMPLCEAALSAWGASDPKRVAKALAVYLQYYDRCEKVAKCDFHTDGELAGFFFFHDVYHATNAAMQLPETAQKSMRRFFLEKLTSLPEIDGSFVDDHEMGKSCGTAFALLALKNVLAEPTR